MFRRFIEEEGGQAGIEYIMLVGGVILVGLMVFTMYQRMTKRGALAIEAGVGSFANKSVNVINESTAYIYS
ncbi:MAG: hypothetical protein ACE5PM_09025 [Candidatus Hydrothermarchaeales archaeon]